jgi:adenylate cyclase
VARGRTAGDGNAHRYLHRPAVSGTLGSRERWEYVVVGDTMNTASRLESFDKELYPPDPMTRPCRILVGASTLGHLGTMFHAEWVAEAHLKGKEQLVGIYRIVGQRPASIQEEWIEPATTSGRDDREAP